MGNLAFQDVDLLLSDIQRSAPNREFLGLQSVQELAKAVQFIGWVGVVHKPMISRWPLFDQTATRARSRSLDHLVGASEQRGRHFKAERLRSSEIDDQFTKGSDDVGRFQSRFHHAGCQSRAAIRA
jgi:hypothetical protein